MKTSDRGHGDRYIGSLFRVDEPVPDDSDDSQRERVLRIDFRSTLSRCLSFIINLRRISHLLDDLVGVGMLIPVAGLTVVQVFGPLAQGSWGQVHWFTL